MTGRDRVCTSLTTMSSMLPRRLKRRLVQFSLRALSGSTSVAGCHKLRDAEHGKAGWSGENEPGAHGPSASAAWPRSTSTGDLDVAGGDHADVDIGVGQRLKQLGGHAGVRPHAAAHDRHLRQVGAVLHAAGAKLGHRLFGGGQRLGQSSCGTVNETSASPPAPTSCTTMSMGILRTAIW